VGKVAENLIEIRRNTQAKTPKCIGSNLGYNTYSSVKDEITNPKRKAL
jgi:hypothetical protein